MNTAAIDYPWIKSYPSDINWDAEIPSRPIFDMLDQTAKNYGDNPAFDFLGAKQSWQEIDIATKKFAKGLQESGIKKGDKVGIFLPNCPLFVVAYYALMRIGATAVNYNPLYAEAELVNMIEDSETDTIITLDLQLLFGKMEKMLSNTRLKTLVIASFTDMLPFPKNVLFKLVKGKELSSIPESKRILRYSDLTNNDGAYQKVDVNPDEDIALYQYTGGTTGVPKGAMLTHTNITANTEQATLWLGCKEGEEKCWV